ncbi:uncharacterized protein L199_005986 [Kwoniella botswanensis]|uniref:uncharacterized protein n=1 Tax=Kwoniella botswanensis TaxID=1268659 RepID=UPI00315CCF08
MSLDQPAPAATSFSPSNYSHLHGPDPKLTLSSVVIPTADNEEESISQFRGHLPNEILSFIISFADQSTLGNLMGVRKTTYRLAAPTLYSHITITRQNADKLFVGLPRSTGCQRTRVPPMADGPTSSHVASRPIKLRWPDVRMESEDEEEIDQSHTPTNKYAYPTVRSEKRKLALFKFTRIITLTTRMPTQLCQDLRGWARRECRKHKRRLFPKFETLIITGKCLKDCADWQDRHLIPLEDIADDQFFGVLPMLGRIKNLCITSPTYDEDDYDDYILRRSRPDVELLSNSSFKSMCTRRFKRIVNVVLPDLIVHFNERLTLSKKSPNITFHNIISHKRPPCEMDHTLFLAPYTPADRPTALHERCPRVNKMTRASQMRDLDDTIYWEYDFDKMIIGVPDAEMEDIDWDKMFEKANGSDAGHPVDVQKSSQLSPCPCCFTKEGIQ